MYVNLKNLSMVLFEDNLMVKYLWDKSVNQLRDCEIILMELYILARQNPFLCLVYLKIFFYKHMYIYSGTYTCMESLLSSLPDSKFN